MHNNPLSWRRLNRRAIEIIIAATFAIALVATLVVMVGDNKDSKTTAADAGVVIAAPKGVESKSTTTTTTAPEKTTKSVAADVSSSSTTTVAPVVVVAGRVAAPVSTDTSTTTGTATTTSTTTTTTVVGTTTPTTTTVGTTTPTAPTTTTIPTTTTVAPTTTAPTTTVPTTTTVVLPPAGVTNLTLKVLRWINTPAEGVSQEQVLLNWHDNSNNETGFHVYQDFVGCIGAGLSTVVLKATLPPNTVTTVINDAANYMWRGCLSNGMRVVAFNEAGEGGPVGPFGGGAFIYPPKPKVPVIVSYTHISSSQTQLTWRHDAVDGFSTFWFILGDVNGTPVTGNLNGFTSQVLAFPTVEYTVIAPVTAPSPSSPTCVTIRARNGYFHAYDWDYSAVSQPFCLT